MGKHKNWRKFAKKERRKQKRQEFAKQRDEIKRLERLQHEQSPTYKAWLENQEKAEQFQIQEEVRIAAECEAQWLQAEAEAQKEWLELQKKLAYAREERAKQNARIKEEWDREQRKLKELKEQKEKEEETKRQAHAEFLEQLNNFITNDGDMPEGLSKTIETNPNKPICPFFRKTATCRFKDFCSRNHIRPGVSRILLITNFYSHYSLEQTENEHGSDSILEFETHDTYHHFKEFFYDVFPEMEKFGRIVQFKVCCNHEPHLRGNVYVEYNSCREAVRSYRAFMGRWYGGKQLHVEFCNVHSWKSAICGLFFKNTCPKGSSCNFLHVFRNPGNLFSKADRDLHKTPPIRDIESECSEARHWRWSESPERLPHKEINGSEHRHRRHKSRKRERSNNRSREHRNKCRRSRSRSSSRRSHHSRSSKSSSQRSIRQSSNTNT